jgi:hypothetical protein
MRQKGSILVTILLISLFLTSFIFSLMVLAGSNLNRARSRILLLQAQYAAESAADTAIAQLNAGNSTYTGTTSDVTVLTTGQYKSTFAVSVTSGSTGKEKVLTATGKVYAPVTATTPRYTRRIEVISQRSSATVSTSMLSRNIIDIDSGVKTIKAKEIYANGYINTNKNTTDLIAENITVVDKNTGATNCSIGGTGNLVKPTSFTTPGQTKTKITVGYNNCINPPGNSSNANFDVLINQTNLSKIQSTLIPFSQVMDSSYLSSVNNCNDWTSGTFPRSIPSTGNNKKTHYPDSGSNISTSCGTSGDLQLATGQYTIRDNVHIRANLCAASGCSPTFYNPDNSAAGTKFIFVEGSVNFDSITTASGSGPIVLVVNGTDPSSLASTCPLGGSIYISKSGTTSAPQLYLLASNGICIDKTKFGSQPALGGMSAKNLYVASSPGTPFDLNLNVAFPVDQIPVDLSWRAVRYRRL